MNLKWLVSSADDVLNNVAKRLGCSLWGPEASSLGGVENGSEIMGDER